MIIVSYILICFVRKSTALTHNDIFPLDSGVKHAVALLFNDIYCFSLQNWGGGEEGRD